MITVKEKIIQEIQHIQDENLLAEIHLLLQNVYGTKQVLITNDQQKANIAEARKEYLNGNFHTNESLFKDLIDE
ncbi:hypothetical protein [uncultured Mucilaginibacter sp.]|uniref:hypothetical protein n=1 Tax=uncultured Mucilaginibacter sp. TaxID=797541 RepID=UPI0026305157|nr:hypothetical protein [uncultured Mucilaginibacter sp.]